MRFLFRLIFWLILLSPFALAALAWFGLEDQPRVTSQRQLSHTDIARAQEIIKRNDPRKLPAGSRRTVRVSQADVELASNYLLRRVNGAAKVDLHRGSANLHATVRIPKLPMKQFMNLVLTVEDTDGIPKLRGLRIGQIEVPDLLTEWIVRLALQRVYDTSQVQLAQDVVQDLDLKPGSAAITYVWQPDLIDRARDTLLARADKQALVAYRNLLAKLHAKGQARRGSAAAALKPLFAEAQRRSRVSDPTDENRALLLVLGAWVNGRGMDKLVPPAKQVGSVSEYGLSLEGRGDFGQHFLTSAALVAGGDSSLSDAIGLFKEVQDSDGGSGFSFTDLAADRAGTRFGELAVGSADSAKRVQRLMAAGVKETDIIPRARDLPEHMNQAEFKRRFGGTEDPRYKKVKAEIERRVAACRLYRET